MSNLLLKEKYQIVKAYLNEIDPTFRFITFPIIDPNSPNAQLKITHVKTLPTLSFYKIIESDLDSIIDQPFVTNQNLMILAQKIIDNLKIDREVMSYNQKLRQVQVTAHKDLLRIFLEVKNIVQNIEKNLALEKKGSFIDMLFTNIKQLNALISEAQLIYQALSQIEIKTSIDLLHYVGLFSEQQNSKLLIAFNYDENSIEMIDFQDHVLQILEDSYYDCAHSTEDSIAAKSAYLALQMKNSLEEGKEYFQVTNCLFHQLSAFIYLEFKRMNYYTKEELKKLEPYIAKINKNICEILYLHFIKKRETEKIKDLQINSYFHQYQIKEFVIAARKYFNFEQLTNILTSLLDNRIVNDPDFEQFEFAGQVKEIQLGIKEPLDSKQNIEIVRDIFKRSNKLILELRHCKEVYNLYTAECFTAFFERKKMKRKNTIKSLKNEILLFQQTLIFIEEIIKNDGALKGQIGLSREFIAKVNQLEITFQDIVSKKTVRSKLPHQNTEINKIRNIAKTLYSDSEDVIVELKKYQKQFEQYYDHLFENTFFNLKRTIEQLYEMQDKIIIILQKESKILGSECSQIHQETDILLKDIYDFLQQVDVNVLTKTDNKNFLDEIGSNILKILMRLKKKQAQIEMQLQDKSLVVSHKLSSELYKMGQSLSYQLTNLEGLGIVIESRSYFNSALIVNTMYEFLDNEPKFNCLDSILQDLPEHKKDVEQFIQEYYPKVSQQLKTLAKARIELEQYFYTNFLEMKNCYITIIQCYKMYNEKYKDQFVLLDINFLNVISPIVTSYQKISNIVIDITSNNIFQEDLKKKLRDSLNKYINKVKQVYATDELQQIHKTAHILLFYSQTKDEIIQKFYKSVQENMEYGFNQVEQVLKNVQVPLFEYFTLMKDMKWVRLFQKLKGQSMTFVNIDEYNSLVEKAEDLDEFFTNILQNMQSIENSYEDYKTAIARMPDPEQRKELQQFVYQILEQILVQYRYEYDQDKKKMAFSFVSLLENIFQIQLG